MRPVVMTGHLRLAIGEDRLIVLHDVVGRQATILDRQRHRPTRRMETHPQVGRGRDRGTEQIAAIPRVDIEMVGRGGASRQGQFGQADPCADMGGLLVESAPVGIERL
jgi:hypothetical protein